MKKFILVFVLIFATLSFANAQTTTNVSLSVDSYDWNKLVVSSFFNKHSGINFQFWYKNLTDQKRFRLSYQKKLFTYKKEKTDVQLTGGLGLQVTTRKRSFASKQILVSNDFQFKYKLSKNLSFNTRVANFLSVSPNAKQGDHTDKLITNIGIKYKKLAAFYYADYLFAFKTGVRNNYQGVGGTYDLHKNFTVGAIIYTDLKEQVLKKPVKKAHLVGTFAYRF